MQRFLTAALSVCPQAAGGNSWKTTTVVNESPEKNETLAHLLKKLQRGEITTTTFCTKVVGKLSKSASFKVIKNCSFIGASSDLKGKKSVFEFSSMGKDNDKVEELRGKMKEMLERVTKKLDELKKQKNKCQKDLEEKLGKKLKEDSELESGVTAEEQSVEAKKETEKKAKSDSVKDGIEKMSEDEECAKKNCPPVFRAPGCPPKDSGECQTDK